MAACFVSQCVSQSVGQWVKFLVPVPTFCLIHVSFMQRQIKIICGILMPYNVENILQMGLLGSKVIKAVMNDK